LKPTNIKIEVKSEAGDSVKTYTLSISSSLIPPTNLSLAKDTSRSKIIVKFDQSKDYRVNGYVVLRAQKGTDIPDSISNKTKILHAGTYNEINTYVDDDGDGSYTDGVGGGSPYYSYRVFAYDKEGDDMVFSKGTDLHTRSVGRIQVTYKMTDFGGKLMRYGGFQGRANIVADVFLREGESGKELTHWHAYDYMSGDNKDGDAVFFLTDVFDTTKKGAKLDTMPTTKEYTKNIGSSGLYLLFSVLSKSCDDHDYTKCASYDEVEKDITWSYDEMAKVLKNDIKGDGKVAPYKGSFKYLVGPSGIAFNPSINVCGDKCGKDPHTGYKFKFDYKWVDDKDTY
jgi:hypothetical protein